MALLHVNFFSKTLSMCVQMDVILPQKPTGLIGINPKETSGKYPTLYLLHGMSDDHTIWQRRTSIERYAASHNLAIIMPAVNHSFYCNEQGGERYWVIMMAASVRFSKDTTARCLRLAVHLS